MKSLVQDVDQEVAESESHSQVLWKEGKVESQQPIVRSVRNRLQSLLVWGFGISLAFASGWWFANKQHEESEKIVLPPAEKNATSDAMKITVQPVQFRSVRRLIDAVGTIHGFEEVSISAKTEGRVTRIRHDLADRVAPGELLLEIDRTDAQLAVEQAERSLQAELAKWGFLQVPQPTDDLNNVPTVVSAKLRADLAKSRLQRMLPLYSAKAVSLEELDQAKSEAQVTESDLSNQLLLAKGGAATSRLKNADLAIARQRLQDTEIRVPTPSMPTRQEEALYSISSRLVSEGTMVRPGMELFRLVLGRTLKLRLAVPEIHSSAIVEGQEVEVRTSSQATPVAGRVSRISPSIDASTRTFQLEVEVPNEDHRLKPGGFARASILVGVDDNVPTVPVTGLDTFAGINKIFLIVDGRAKEVQVTTGEQNEDWIEIVSPSIPRGAIIATSAQRLLSDETPVLIRSSDSSSNIETTDPTSTETSDSESTP